MIPSAFSGVLYSSSFVFLTIAVLRREDEVLGLLEVARLDDGADLLALAERQQVDDRAALRLARAERQLVHLQPVDLADGREEEEVVVRRGDEEVLDVVLVLQVHAHHAAAAAPLLAVGGHRQPLDVAERVIAITMSSSAIRSSSSSSSSARDDLRAPVVVPAVDLLELEQLLADQRRRCGPRRRGSCAARRSAPAGRRTRPRSRLRASAVSARSRRSRIACAWISLSSNFSIRPVARRVGVGGRADQRDHRVEVVERDQVALRGCARAPPPCAARTSTGG